MCNLLLNLKSEAVYDIISTEQDAQCLLSLSLSEAVAERGEVDVTFSCFYVIFLFRGCFGRSRYTGLTPGWVD